MHGGRIEAFSDGPGTGSEFVVYLPIVQRQVTPPPTAENGKPAAQPAAETTLRILVVDDNRDAADSLGLYLKRLATACGPRTMVRKRSKQRPSFCRTWCFWISACRS